MKGFSPVVLLLLLLTVLMAQVSRGQQSAPLTYTLDAPATGIQTDAALGQSLVMNGQYVVAGAPQDDWAGQNAGVVKVFDPETGDLLWVLANPAPGAGDQFGYALALSGSRLVVGAHLDDTAGLNAGMVYVYDLAGPSPTEPQWVLQHPQAAASDNFGFSVAISGNLVAVSCHLDDVGATNAGTVLIYDLASATPTVPTLVVGNPNAALNDQFGYSVALSGTRLAVGTPQDDTGASNDGTVYVFELAGASPTVPVVSLPNPHPAGQDQFGFTLAMAGNVLVVGVPFDDALASNAGRVYGYDFGLGYSSTASWVLDNPAPVSNDQFGYAVALHGQRLVVGVPADDDGGFDTGRAFVYDLGGLTPLVPVASLVKAARMAEDKLGFAVAIWDEMVAAGVPSDDVGTFNTGSVAMFDLASSTPEEMVRLLADASPSAQDAFGAAVSIAGQRIVIGAPRNNSGAPNGGIAYVYDLAAGPPTAPWLTLNHPEPGNGDEMGTTVAISGRWVAVGVSYADRNEIIDSGVVYVFDLTSATPTQPALVVLNPEPQPGDRFGNAVALSGDRLLVGARLDDALAVNSGSAYVYELAGAEPTQPSQILRNPSPAAGDGFGEAVSLSGALAVVGAAGDNTGATSAGSAYVYDLAGATPSVPLVTLNNPAPAANDAFGIAVSIHGQRVVVGAHLDDALATDAGSAYLYDLTSPTPQVPVVTWQNPNPASSDQFGLAVAVDGSRVLIGAPLDDQGGQNSGIAYLYEVESATPTVPELVLTHSPRRVQDVFGGAVGLSGERAVVGAAGVDTVAWDKGAAFVFRATLAAEAVDIALEQPVGAELFSGVSTVAFGSLVLGASGVEREFTIRNAGLEPLTGVAVQLTGVHESDFVVVEAPPGTVPTGESATFRLRFTPGGGGPRSAVLQVLSNDPDESPFLIGLSGSGIVPLPEIEIEQPADQGLTSGQSLVGFGQVVAQQDMTERVFVVRNSGLADLTGLALEITGLHGTEFTVVTAPATSLEPGGSTTFRVRFTPLGGGERLAMLRVASNDADENPFEIPLQGVGIVIPEIVVEQPQGTVLTSGVAVVDFAEARVNQQATDRVLTVRNVGTGDLTGVTVTLAGAQAADWSLVAAPAPVIPVGGSSQFIVRFEPLAGGPRTAQIVITSNDPVQSPFVVGMTGVGKVFPQLVLEQPVGTVLMHGESTVSFEGVKVGGAPRSLSFVLSNAGTAELTGIALSLAGPNAADFEVTSAPASSVPVGESSSFTVRFAPLVPGESVAVLRVASNDPEHDPFEIELGGTGLAVPILGLEQPADQPLVLGEAEVDFGQAILGQTPAERAFVLRNLGTGDLNVLSRVISGPDAEAFSFAVQPMSALDPGASSGFVMRFAPTTAGEKRAVVTFLSNDEDRSPFVVELIGTAVALPQLLVETEAGQSLPPGSGEVSFGEAAVAGAPVLVELVLRNGGTANLTDLGQSFLGAAAADFALVSELPAVLEPGASANVTLRFAPLAGGARAAQWRLTSNDGVTGDYLMNLSGVGLVSPQIQLADPAAQPLANGSGEVAFGSALVARESTLRTLVMSNQGTGELGQIAVTLSGAHAGDFSLETAVAGTLAAGAQQAVSLRFAPSGAGVRTAVLQVTSDDPDNGTYLVALTGMGLVAPEMILEQPVGTPLTAGSAEVNFGIAIMGGEEPGLRRVLMRNGGTAELTMVQWSLTGPAAADYQMVTAPPTSLAVGQEAEFELRFDPAAEGTRAAVLVLTSNDAARSPFEIALTGVGLALPQLAVEQPVGQRLVNGAGLVEFGVAQVRDGLADRSFTVRNLGSARLELTGLNLTGAGAADYQVVIAPAMGLEPGESTSMVVRFAPTVFGDRNATLTVLSNDEGASPFAISLNGYGEVVPDLVVEHPVGQPLESGLSTAISFGAVALGGDGTLRSFQVSNVGTGDLSFTDISFSGVHAADFAVVTPPPAVLPAGQSAAFLVRFQPSAAGGRSALMRLFSNDPDSNPFEVLVSGTGLAVPDIGVESPVGSGLVSGLASIDFGPMIMGEALIEREILLRNDGTAVLTDFAIEVVGAQAADFTLDGFRDAPLGVGETSTFRLRFLALAEGTRQATLRIYSNDPDESPFEIALVGTGIALPKLRVELADGSTVANGGAGLAFGTVFVNAAPSEQVLRLRNEGAAELTLLNVAFEGAQAADFALVTSAISSLSPGASAELTLRFAPAAGGARTGLLRITSNDLAATPFLVPLQGAGNTPLLAFSTWAAEDYQLQGAAAAPEAMPQGDGVPNLLKYAFNMAADTPDSSILVPGIGTSGLPFTSRTTRRGGSYLRIEFVRRIGSGLIYQPKISSNLTPGSWTPVTALPLISPVDEQFERVIYEEFYNPSVTMCLFGRVDVTLP